MAGYVAHKGMKEFGGEASRQEKAYHVAFGTVPVAFWHSACGLLAQCLWPHHSYQARTISA